MKRPLWALGDTDIQANEEGIKWLESVREHVVDIREISFTWNPASLAANTHVEETVSVTGLRVGDLILSVTKPTFTQGFQIGQGRVATADNLEIQVVNGTGLASNPDSESYKVIYIKNTRAS